MPTGLRSVGGPVPPPRLAWAAAVLAVGVLLCIAATSRWGPLGVLLIVPCASWALFLVTSARETESAVDAHASGAPPTQEFGQKSLEPPEASRPSMAEEFAVLPGLQLACDRHGRLLAVSTRLAARFAVPPTSLVDQPLYGLFEGADQAALVTLLHGDWAAVSPAPAPLYLRQAAGLPEAVTAERAVRTFERAAGPVFHLLLARAQTDTPARPEGVLEDAVFRALVDEQPELVSLARADGELLYVNRAYSAAFGRASAQLVGSNLFDNVSEGDRASVRRHLQRVFETGRAIVDQNRMVSSGGVVRWVEWMNRPLSVAAVADPLLYSVGRDITERRHTEEAMRLLHREQSAIINSEMVGITKVRERCYQWVNPGAARMLAYDAAELAGMACERVYPDADTFRALGEAAYPVIRAGRTFRGESRMLRKDGGIIWVEATGVLFDPEHDETLWLLTDITARKEAELALQARLGSSPG